MTNKSAPGSVVPSQTPQGALSVAWAIFWRSNIYMLTFLVIAMTIAQCAILAVYNFGDLALLNRFAVTLFEKTSVGLFTLSSRGVIVSTVLLILYGILTLYFVYRALKKIPHLTFKAFTIDLSDDQIISVLWRMAMIWLIFYGVIMIPLDHISPVVAEFLGDIVGALGYYVAIRILMTRPIFGFYLRKRMR